MIVKAGHMSISLFGFIPQTHEQISFENLMEKDFLLILGIDYR